MRRTALAGEVCPDAVVAFTIGRADRMIEDKGAFMTPEEVAGLLKVSIYTVRRWINQQAIPAYKVGRGWRIETAEFERWMRDNRQGHADDS